MSTRVSERRLPASGRAEITSLLGPASLREDSFVTARHLADWAGSDSVRLAEASEMVLSLARKQTKHRAGLALMATRLAWKGLNGDGPRPSDGKTDRSRALEAYNAALAVFVDATAPELAAGALSPVATPDGMVAPAVNYETLPPVEAGYFDELVAADRLTIRGIRTRAVVKGAGVALVGRRLPAKERAREMENHSPRGIAMAVSCVAEFGRNGRVVIRMLDPIRTETVSLRGRRVPVAADFTAPLALSMGGINDLLLGIRNLLNVSAGAVDAGVYSLDPGDPDRTPVLLIHGLSSTPIVWRNLVSAALADPVIRRRYQFWFAYYPTGAPVMVSAALIRQDTENLRRQYKQSRDPALRHIDLVGYSMGGNIARILATDIGTRLWDRIATVPFDSVPLKPGDRETVRKSVFFEAIPGVRVVVFVATPHRGASMADASFAQWGARLVRLPGDLVSFQSRFFEAIGDALQGDLSIPPRLTGIDSLSARSPLYAAWEGVPLAPGVRFYSIIGDRGRGDTPESSDGIVAYWSSHLEGAESELIVPTGHDAQDYPGTEREILRILRENIRKK